MKNLELFRIHAFVFFASLACQIQAQQFDPVKLSELHGGLVVQLGASEMDAATELSRTGRYLIHVLDPDPETVQSAQMHLHKEGHYGLAWVENHRGSGRLPYAENMVNLILVRDFTVADTELFRVLSPGGRLRLRTPGS